MGKRELIEKAEKIWFNIKFRYLILISLFILCFFIFGFFSYFIGQDLNWDLLNYHYYGPYSLLNERLEIDCAPAQFTTYANPLLDLPFYYGSQIMKPWLVGFILGGVHGINFFLLLILSYLLFSNIGEKRRLVLSLICAIVGVYAPMFILEFGTTFNDNLISIFVLSGLILMIKSYSLDLNNKKYLYLILFGGCLFGLGIGFKLSHAPYLIAVIIAFFLCIYSFRNKIKNSLFFFVGALVGLFFSSGYWMVKMFKLFGSPLFPFYNAFFKSPWYEYINFADIRFLPKTLFHVLFYPIYFALDSTLVIEKPFAFRDIRFALVYLILLVFLLVFIYFFIKNRFYKNTQKHTINDCFNNFDTKEIFFIYFFIFSYIIWQFKFSIYRYLITLELIAPILIVLLIEKFKINVKIKNIILFVLFALILVLLILPDIKKSDWSNSLFDVSINQDKILNDATILIIGKYPRSYIIPFFDNKNMTFVSLENNLFRRGKDNLLMKRCEEIILDNREKLYLLAKENELQNNSKILVKYNISIIQSENYSITTNIETLYLFRLK